ncbi:MAG: methyltransferase domain-containing protein, partial [Bacteroidota bacterium]
TPLPPEAFRRVDESPDADFYQVPRFVTHIDEAAIQAVTSLYREFFPAGGSILDLMSSWISHLPIDVDYKEVIGLGMNAKELEANPRLNKWLVQDLNQDTVLPFEDNYFDGAGICVSIDYLIRPVEVLKELARVLKSGAPLVITFSNRCFPSKAIAIWHHLNEQERVVLVQQFLLQAGGWQDIKMLDRTYPWGRDPLYAVVGIRA